MIASYKLETTTFGIDTHRTKYVFLTASETSTCLINIGQFCHISKAAFSVKYSQARIIALFIKSNEDISRYFEVIVNLRSQLPQAVYLDDGNYAVATDRETELRVTCNRNNLAASSLIVKPPFQVVRLELTCTAYNEKITLLPGAYFHSQTNYRPNMKHISVYWTVQVLV